MVESTPLRIQKIDHVEFAVSELERSSEVFVRLGFEKVSQRENRERQLRSLLFCQGDIYIVLSSSALRVDPVSQFVGSHGDGVYNVAFLCDDVVTVIEQAEKRGAQIADRPKAYKKDSGQIQYASVHAFGDVRHTFVSRQGNLFLDGFDAPMRPAPGGVGLASIDHFVGAVTENEVEGWDQFYRDVMGFAPIPEERATYFASVLHHEGIPLFIPLLTEGKLNPAKDFLEVNHGSGIQSLGIRCPKLIPSVERLRANGIPFQQVPEEYYEELRTTDNLDQTQREAITREGILYEARNGGHFLHLVTQPLIGPFRFHLVERQNASGVGQESFGRLSQSVEKQRLNQNPKPGL